MFQDKTQTAENGLALLKGCNAVLGHLGTSLRASWEALVRSVATLGKNRAITCVLLPAVLLSANTYRWKDRDGKVHYGAVVPPRIRWSAI